MPRERRFYRDSFASVSWKIPIHYVGFKLTRFNWDWRECVLCRWLRILERGGKVKIIGNTRRMGLSSIEISCWINLRVREGIRTFRRVKVWAPMPSTRARTEMPFGVHMGGCNMLGIFVAILITSFCACHLPKTTNAVWTREINSSNNRNGPVSGIIRRLQHSTDSVLYPEMS